MPISTIAKRAGRSVIDFGSLDVEGHELEVLAHDWEAHGVRVHALMVEDHHQVPPIKVVHFGFILTDRNELGGPIDGPHALEAGRCGGH